MRICRDNATPVRILGSVTDDGFIIFGERIKASVKSLKEDYDSSIERALTEGSAVVGVDVA